MGDGIYTVLVNARRASCCIDDVGAFDQNEIFVCLCIQTEKTINLFPIRENLDNLHVIPHRNSVSTALGFKHLGHLAAGVGADTGGTVSGIMVSLVTHVFPVAVYRERDAEFHKPEK